DADRTDRETTTVEHLHRGGKALADVLLAADDSADWHAHILEDDIAGVGALLAHLAILLAERDAGKVRIDQKRADARRGAGLQIRAGKDGEDARLRCVGDEALGAVEYELIPFTPRRGAQRARVGTSFRLGQRER